MPRIKVLAFAGHQVDINYIGEPDICPFCHEKITPRRYQSYLNQEFLETIFVCPNNECQRTFIGIYNKYSGQYKFDSTSIGNHKPRVFSENISTLSPNFVEIYNQVKTSEYYKLQHISGMGYRKALEFLIKDYLISKNPDKEQKIKDKFLGKCIKQDIDNENLKEIAQRAAWLGNDETHYVRVWKTKDIEDLKKLIDISAHWIEMELLTEQYRTEMN